MKIIVCVNGSNYLKINSIQKSSTKNFLINKIFTSIMYSNCKTQENIYCFLGYELTNQSTMPWLSPALFIWQSSKSVQFL